MPGFTGSDVKSLRGAYNNIYANQNNIEFTEDQLIEHFECWVDSLVENGYNLNDHTFDEIYETYLNENWNWRQLGTQARKQLDRAGGAIWKGVTTAASATSEFGKGLVTGKEKDEPPSTPSTAKTKPSSGVKVDLRLPSVQQFVNPKWWAPDRPATAPSAAKTKYRVDASGRMVRSEETDIEEQTRVRARQTKGGKSVFGSVETKGGKPVPGSFKPATGSTADIKKAEVEYNIARNERQRRLAQSDPNAYFGTSNPPAPFRTPSDRNLPVVDAPIPRREPPTAKPKPELKPPAPAQTGDRTKDLSTWAKANKSMIQKVGTPQQRAVLSAAEKGTAMPAPRPISKDIEDLKGMQKASQERQAAQSGPMYSSPDVTSKMSQRTKNILGVKEEYDAYDVVLEYLLSQGHVDTLEEALYVMMEMPAETIQGICEAQGEWFRGVLNPNNSAAAKAQNTSPFVKPTKPLPSTASPFVKPASRDDSGRLTTYGAGGGAAAERAGKSRAEVMGQGAKNQENKKRAQPVNQGPDFGR